MIKIQVKRAAYSGTSADLAGKFVLIERRTNDARGIRAQVLNDDGSIGEAVTIHQSADLDMATAKEVFLWHRIKPGGRIEDGSAGMVLCDSRILNAKTMEDSNKSVSWLVPCAGCAEVIREDGDEFDPHVIIVDNLENK